MNINDVKEILVKNSIPDSLYSINSLGSGECMCIIYSNGKWITGFSEKGSITNPTYHESENDACIIFLKNIEKIYYEYTNKHIMLLK